MNPRRTQEKQEETSIPIPIKEVNDDANLLELLADMEHKLLIDEDNLGYKHPKVAEDWRHLGSVLRQLGRLTSAKDAFKHALAISEAVYGPVHPDAADDHRRLGTVLYELSDFTNAKDAFEKALAIDEDTYGTRHPNTAIDHRFLGDISREMGNLEDAKFYYERVLTIDEASLGPNHPEIAIDLHKLGTVLRDLGDLKSAKEYIERALVIRQVPSEFDDPLTPITAIAYDDPGQTRPSISATDLSTATLLSEGAKEAEGTSLTLPLSEEISKVLDEVVAKTGIDRTEILRRAIVLMAAATTAKSAGFKIGIFDQNNNPIMELVDI